MDVLLRLPRLQTPLLGHLDLLLSAVLPGLVPAVLFVGLNVTLFRSCYKVIYTKLTSQHFSSGYFLQCSLGSDQHRCLGTSTQVSCGSSQQESTANRTCQCMTSTKSESLPGVSWHFLTGFHQHFLAFLHFLWWEE